MSSICILSKFKPILLDIICLISGCILPLAFAPFNYWFLAIVSLAVLYYCWLNTTITRSFFRGFLFSVGFYGVGVSWVYVSIHKFGNASIPLALLITFLFVFSLALFTSFQTFFNNFLIRRDSICKLLIVFPSIWVIFEWIRGFLFTGFPWLYLGYSQVDSPLMGYAAIFGVFGVSFFVAMSASLIVGILRYKNKRIFLLVTLLLIWVVSFFLSNITWTKPSGDPISVSIIQGNISQEDKWKPQNVLSILNEYQKLTEPNLKNDLIIWPEASVPVPLPYSQNFIDDLSQKIKQNNTNLILGIPIESEIKDKYYNSALLLNNESEIYHKRHLVPFGEYLPFEKWLKGLINFFDIPMSDFIPGSYSQKPIFTNNIFVAIYVCYEIAYAELVRSDLPKADLLVTLTDDSWFGDSIAPAQHLQIAQMRSLETGRYVICSTNNGITAIISPNGKVIKTLPQFEIHVLNSEVYAMSGVTPWIKFGTTIIMSFIFLLVLFAVVFDKFYSRKII